MLKRSFILTDRLRIPLSGVIGERLLSERMGGTMFEKITRFLESKVNAGALADLPFDRRHVAVAALLVEAARYDGMFDPVERTAITRLIQTHFHLTRDQADTLVSLAEARERATIGDWVFCKAVIEGFDAKERADIVADLWAVVYSDRALHRFENSLVERIAKNLGVNWDEIVATRVIAEDRAQKGGGA